MSAVDVDGRVHVEAGRLREFVAGLFAATGLPPADAATVAECLVRANLRGTDTHGVFRAPTYLKRLREGLNNRAPNIAVRKVADAASHVDGDNGMGAVVGRRAMGEAIELARRHGTGLVSVCNSNHYGMAAFYVLQAMEAGMIGIAFTNASPAFPPWGGRAPFFGTSPMAFAVPAGREPSFVLDMAMSVLARGNVYVAAQAGTSIPPGLALDSEGRPTTDPKALIDGGSMLPFGGVKGAALSMLMDILSGVLSGAAFGGEVGNPHQSFDRPQNVGHFFLCLRTDLFMPEEMFLARMDELVVRMKAQPRAAGVEEILVPGEREARREKERLRTGIPLAADVHAALDAEAARCGLAPLEILAAPVAID
ncbi:Ldh family oxidoreductase [Ancylobacter mangrovi]|uniref:Ldh family oxidoreductase n=1 Tax=Ancylobacter mangrovi TaxID=2972472 RepID=UPI002161446D|nr:Ldh family oxidoreductase [Ancylobacter mangrovi]MCS0505040.1 Ldh family oxidoreductase [Ancylobacter mangrovi]